MLVAHGVAKTAPSALTLQLLPPRVAEPLVKLMEDAVTTLLLLLSGLPCCRRFAIVVWALYLGDTMSLPRHTTLLSKKKQDLSAVTLSSFSGMAVAPTRPVLTPPTKDVPDCGNHLVSPAQPNSGASVAVVPGMRVQSHATGTLAYSRPVW